MQDLTSASNNGPASPSPGLPAGSSEVATVPSQGLGETGAAPEPMALEIKALQRQALNTQAAIKQLQLEDASDNYAGFPPALPGMLTPAAVLPTALALILMGLLAWVLVRRASLRQVAAPASAGHSTYGREAVSPKASDHASRVTYRPAPSKWLWKSLDHLPRVVYREQKPTTTESEPPLAGEPIPASIPRAGVGAEAAPLSQWLPPDSEWSSSQFAGLPKSDLPSAAKASAAKVQDSVPPEVDLDEQALGSLDSSGFAPSANSLMFVDDAAAGAVEHVRKSLAHKRAARANVWGLDSGHPDQMDGPDSAFERIALRQALQQGREDVEVVEALTEAAPQDTMPPHPVDVPVPRVLPDRSGAPALVVQDETADLAEFQPTENPQVLDELPAALIQAPAQEPEPEPALEPEFDGDVKLALAKEFASLGLHAAARELANEVLVDAHVAPQTQAHALLQQLDQREQARALEEAKSDATDTDSPAIA